MAVVNIGKRRKLDSESRQVLTQVLKSAPMRICADEPLDTDRLGVPREIVEMSNKSALRQLKVLHEQEQRW